MEVGSLSPGSSSSSKQGRWYLTASNSNNAQSNTRHITTRSTVVFC
jgi:hypothetical protein